MFVSALGEFDTNQLIYNNLKINLEMDYNNKNLRYFVKDIQIQKPIDFTKENGHDFIKKAYNENGVELSTIEKEIIKHIIP